MAASPGFSEEVDEHLTAVLKDLLKNVQPQRDGRSARNPNSRKSNPTDVGSSHETTVINDINDGSCLYDLRLRGIPQDWSDEKLLELVKPMRPARVYRPVPSAATNARHSRPLSGEVVYLGFHSMARALRVLDVHARGLVLDGVRIEIERAARFKRTYASVSYSQGHNFWQSDIDTTVTRRENVEHNLRWMRDQGVISGDSGAQVEELMGIFNSVPWSAHLQMPTLICEKPPKIRTPETQAAFENKMNHLRIQMSDTDYLKTVIHYIDTGKLPAGAPSPRKAGPSEQRSARISQNERPQDRLSLESQTNHEQDTRTPVQISSATNAKGVPKTRESSSENPTTSIGLSEEDEESEEKVKLSFAPRNRCRSWTPIPAKQTSLVSPRQITGNDVMTCDEALELLNCHNSPPEDDDCAEAAASSRQENVCAEQESKPSSLPWQSWDD